MGTLKNVLQNWLDENDILMYLTPNEDKLVAAEKFIRTLKRKIFKKC